MIEFETDEEFEKTLQFAKTIKFSKIHCFPYSKREGTIAAKLPEQVSDIDKKIRVAKYIMFILSSQKSFIL